MDEFRLNKLGLGVSAQNLRALGDDGGPSASASTTVKLPEDVKAKIEVKSDASGKVELMKGRLTVDVPIKKGFKPPSVDDIALKIKFEQSLA